MIVLTTKNICIFCQVSLEDIDMMFEFADVDGDGRISWKEFQVMINPPKARVGTQEFKPLKQ